MNIYVPASGNPNARLMILGESPSFEDESHLSPFSGQRGRELDRLLKSAGIYRSDLWLSYICKYCIPYSINKKESVQQRAADAGIDLQNQIDDLRREIQTINPNCILAIGKSALWALTGKNNIEDYRGSVLFSFLGKKVVATFNIDEFIFANFEIKPDSWHRQVAIFDIKRALAQSAFPEVVLPSRVLHVARHSADVFNFIHDNQHSGKVAEDIEASDCIPTCIGLAFSKNEGMTIDLWNGISDNDLANTWIQLARLNMDARIKKVGQNFKYDQDKITKLGLPIDSLYSDTMLKAFCINPELPKTLALNTSLYTLEPFYKNEGMYEGSKQDLFIGCARDACCTYEVDDAHEIDLHEMGLEQYYHNFVMPLHNLYLHIENQGFNVDTDRREILLCKYIAWDEKLRFELYNYTKTYINPNSWKQVDALLYDTLRIPFRVGTGEEVLTSLLNNVVKDPLKRAVIENILESRRVRKTIGNNLAALRDFDGKMRTTYFICLDTGRSSTGQQDAPIRPTQDVIEIDDKGKRKKKKKSLGSAFQTLTKHGDIGPDVRSMYIPEPGHIFLQADSSQAEARVIFLLAEDYEALEDIDKHDYHALTASWFFGGTEFDYSKKVLGYESPIRFAGKTLRHAGHLGAKKRRATIEVNTQARKYKINLVINEAQAEKALTIFHQKQPKIQQVFQASVIKCLEKNRTLIAPVPHGIDAKIGGTRIFYERWGDELFRQAFSYLPQRIVSENTKAAALRIRKHSRWINILVESHDSLLVSVPMDHKFEVAQILKKEFEVEIDFSTCCIPRGKLVIPCEVEEGMNYHDMSKFKFLAPELA